MFVRIHVCLDVGWVGWGEVGAWTVRGGAGRDAAGWGRVGCVGLEWAGQCRGCAGIVWVSFFNFIPVSASFRPHQGYCYEPDGNLQWMRKLWWCCRNNFIVEIMHCRKQCPVYIFFISVIAYLGLHCQRLKAVNSSSVWHKSLSRLWHRPRIQPLLIWRLYWRRDVVMRQLEYRYFLNGVPATLAMEVFPN